MGEGGVCLPQGRRIPRISSCPHGTVWAARVTLGRPLYATSRRKAAWTQSILGARGRSSGQSRCAGLRRRGALQARGDPAAGARRPFGEVGNNDAGVSPGAAGRCQPDPAGGGSARGGACPGDLSRPGRERSRRPATACGDRAPPREGAAPPCQPRGWEPGLSGAGWGSFCPALRPFGRRLPQSPESAKKPPARPKILLRRPQPATCQCAPYPGLVSGAQDPGERPQPSPTPQPCSPGTRLSSLPPAPPPPPPSYLLPPALSQSSTHTPSQTLRGWVHLRAAILNSRLVKPQSAGQPPGNSPALPSPAPGGSRPWLGPSVPEPQLLVRQQKPALHGRRPPRRPSAPPPGRGLSSREGGGHALGSTWTAPELPARVSYHPPPPPLSS